ncbi:MAG: amidophosphoribosyltransferase [Acidiferrobacteraceae bacterium]|nr:amidophosphoribosyltransferase [Acidiferrobacteraceae bacterium]
MCGIVGVIGEPHANQVIYDALTVIQHRGQDAAGIMTCDRGRVHLKKDNGLVRDVFEDRHMAQLHGNLGIGHVRYPTAGCDSRAEAQPFYVNSPFGLAISHNGNLTNLSDLRIALFEEDLRQLNTSSDSEVLLNVLAHELRVSVGATKQRADPKDIFAAIRGVFRRCRGGFSVVGIIVGYGLIAFRDSHGIRPLIFGTKSAPNGKSVMVASESVALDVCGYSGETDVMPGEAIFVDTQGNIHREICAENPSLSPCLFEYVYLARPDSTIDKVAVYKSRLRMGNLLGKRLLGQWPDHDIDVVIPVPDTSRTAALQMANVMGIKYREGFIKNRYIGRTFIMPEQEQRQKSVRQKLNPIGLEFRDKNVLLVDDSIVRGTTSRQIIQMARDAGAKKVYFASAAPPVRHPNVYGIDMPAASELVASGRTIEEIRNEIGADFLIFQALNDLIESVRAGNPAIHDFESSCFSGEYITGDVTPGYLRSLDCDRRKDKSLQTGDALNLTDVGPISEFDPQ